MQFFIDTANLQEIQEIQASLVEPLQKSARVVLEKLPELLTSIGGKNPLLGVGITDSILHSSHPWLAELSWDAVFAISRITHRSLKKK